jgi:UDPglucose--hexose-1-phosphate uridylyltransferase
VVVATERSRRPVNLPWHEPHHRSNGDRAKCPFCPGREGQTPNEVLALRDPGTPPDGPGWRLRVVPNKFPAVKPDAGAPPHGHGGLFATLPAVGRHEVVVECPEHESNPTRLSDEQFRDVLLAYRDRLLALAEDRALKYATVFKNVGAEAGASLGHTHSQIVATPVVPVLIELELAGAHEHHAKHGRCVFCDVLDAERKDGRRLVAETGRFAAVAAFAPRFAYEVWVLPKGHTSRYETLTADAAAELTGLMKRVLTAQDRVLEEPAYNWFLHTAPLRSGELPHYHWHVEVMPRTSRPAGFEWGAGCFITTVTPERAAAELRAAL